MKNLLYVLAISLLLAACSDSGSGAKPFTPHFVGDYKVTTPTDAKLVGQTNIKQSTATTSAGIDSITVTDPIDFGLEFSQDTSFFYGQGVQSIKFYYKDFQPELRIGNDGFAYDFLQRVNAEWVVADSTILIQQFKLTTNSGNCPVCGRVQVEGYIKYPCDVYATDFQDIKMTYFTTDSLQNYIPVKVVTFKTDSLPAVLNEIRQCK